MMVQTRSRLHGIGLIDMGREMDRLMNTLLADGAAPARSRMPAEVVETAEEIRIDLEAPGFREEDLEVTLENDVLTVSGEKKASRDEGAAGEYRLAERRYGRFRRSFAVPATVRGDRCAANYENGVLTLRLPKSEEAKARRIPVGQGS
jgi:HSP20 family protein